MCFHSNVKIDIFTVRLLNFKTSLIEYILYLWNTIQIRVHGGKP